MPNIKKTEVLGNLKEKVNNSTSLIFTEYQGLDANKANDLRKKLAEFGADVVVAKNTLLKIALREKSADLDEEILDSTLKGATATIFTTKDYLSPIKALFDFAKTSELPRVKAAIIEGEFANAEKVEILSKLPSKEVLVAKVLGGFKAPLTGIVNVFGGTQRKFVYVLNSIAQKKA